jgi:hypothetical protein
MWRLSQRLKSVAYVHLPPLGMLSLQCSEGMGHNLADVDAPLTVPQHTPFMRRRGRVVNRGGLENLRGFFVNH